MLHGLTKSREVVDVMHQHGLGVSYDEVLMVRDFWVVNDIKRSLHCPFEVAAGKPAVVIVDNDVFKSDTLTGANPNTHRTNICYVQSHSCDAYSFKNGDRPVFQSTCKLAASLSKMLKELGSNMQKTEPYKTVKHGEPLIRQRSQ